MRLTACLAGNLPLALAALAGACIQGCGYDFDEAFSETPRQVDAAASETATEAAQSDTSLADEALNDSASEEASDTSADEDAIDAKPDADEDAIDAKPDADASIDVVTQHCDNGKQDGDEEGVDCGGSCEPCPAEICNNQADDDKDGKTDCADDDCGQYTCVAGAGVTGWTGPVMVHSGSTCDEGQPPLYSGGWAGLVNEPACTGSSCGCGEATGQTCEPPTLITYGDPGCTTMIQAISVNPANCIPVMGSAGGIALWNGVPANGACSPSGSPGTPGKVAWSVPTVVCPVGSGCASGSSCTTPPASWGNDDFFCIVREGTHVCPTSWPLQADGGGLATVLPTPVCAPCTCTEPTGGECMGQSIQTYSSMGCFMGAMPMQADGICQSNDVKAVEWPSPMGFPQGSHCVPLPPKVQGPLQASGFVTVCCRAAQ